MFSPINTDQMYQLAMKLRDDKAIKQFLADAQDTGDAYQIAAAEATIETIKKLNA